MVWLLRFLTSSSICSMLSSSSHCRLCGPFQFRGQSFWAVWQLTSGPRVATACLKVILNPSQFHRVLHGRLRVRHSATSPSEALDTSSSAEPLEANGSSCDSQWTSASCDHIPRECAGTEKIRPDIVCVTRASLHCCTVTCVLFTCVLLCK